MIDYITEKYGEDYVARVGNRLEYAPKSALGALGQVYGIPFSETLKCSKEFNDDMSVRDNIKNSVEVKKYFDKYPLLIDKMERIVGAVNGFGVHAGGVVISHKDWPLSKVCPLQKTKEDGKVATLWTKDELQGVGLIKYDLLGVNACSQIFYARELVGLDPEQNAPEDIEVFRNVVLSQKHKNIFQFESELGKRAFADLMPMSIMELANASGIIRVVGSESGRQLYDEYKKIVEYRGTNPDDQDFWKQNIRDEVVEDFVYECAIKSMAETYGVLIYQEQLAYLIHFISRGQKTFGEGNVCRKRYEKFSKKFGQLDDVQGQPHLIKEWHKEFMDIANEYIMPYLGKDGWDSPDKDIQDFLHCRINSEGFLPAPRKGVMRWIISSASYLFSKLHAIAYSVNSYNMMYMKHYYPREFWLSALLCDQGDSDKIKNYINAMKNEGVDIKLLPPDVNVSGRNFQFEGDNGIRFGFGAIKGFVKAADVIIEEREKNGSFTSMQDFYDRVNKPKVKVNKANVKNLIFLKAFDSIGPFNNIVNDYNKILKGKDKLVFNESIEDKSLLENKLLGCNILYEHPILSRANFYLSMEHVPEGDSGEVVAIQIIKGFAKTTKNGKPYKLFKVQDLNSNFSVNLFDWNNRDIKDGSYLIARVSRNGDFWTLNGPSQNKGQMPKAQQNKLKGLIKKR